MKKYNATCGKHSNPAPCHKDTANHVNYQSADGLVEIITKTSGAWRFPKHNYPIVCLRLRPKPGTRIQQLEDGSGGLDVLLCHEEVSRHILALQKADPKHGYQVPSVTPKPAERKAHWDEVNRKRWARKQQK